MVFITQAIKHVPLLMVLHPNIFSPPETFWNKSKTCSRRFQNSSTFSGLKRWESLIFRFVFICLPKYSLIGCSTLYGRKLIPVNSL